MKHVYYAVDNTVTYKTLDAWNKITTGGCNWRLSLFEHVYDAVDWSNRPQESFDSLITRRIQSLLSKYKKIRLWYSGGRDSHSVLTELIKRDVEIDEIVFVDWAYHTPVKKEKHEVIQIISRYFRNKALPKINMFTPTYAEYNIYWKFVSNQSQSGGVGSNYGFNLNSFGTLLDLFFETPDDTCNLFGLEKPRLLVKNNNVIFQMVDSSIQHVMSPNHNIEWFFLQDSCPELLQKQIFMLIDNIKIFAYTNGMKFKDALELIQTNKKYYDLYCLFLGLGESVSALTRYGGSKSFGIVKNNYVDLHIVGDNDNWSATSFYENFCSHAQDLIKKYQHEDQQNKLPGVLAKERVICTIEEELL